ncbi:MAG: hypothetical protein ABI451_09635 [Dokdonella sp.]
MRRTSRALFGIIVSLACFAATANAAPPAVPSNLESWRPWVLKDQEFRACPLIAGSQGTSAGDFLCAWAGVLHIDAGSDAATISQHWQVDSESMVPLPGAAGNWPQQVSVDGKPAVVLDNGGPTLRLPPGSYDIRARIPWNERPQTLRVPSAIALVALTVDGAAVAPVQRNGDYLTLGRVAGAPVEADSIDVRVYRKLTDGVPATLTTELELDVSGHAREEIIGPVLPDGFIPLALDSEEWPARVDADGRLHIQVQPGAQTLTLSARATTPIEAVTLAFPKAPWPEQEIWSYESAAQLRVSVANSAVSVDPRQAEVPPEWQNLPAFALADKATLTIEQRSRGLALDEANRLTLDRELWLDFDGGGWFARDRIGGTMQGGWRFDVAAPFTLQRAEAAAIGTDRVKNEPLLVTEGTVAHTTGVEWRTPAVNLLGGVRIERAAEMPVTGWQQTFDQVTEQVNLPYGYRLLAAPGTDSATGSWIAGWTLLDVFVAAITALLALRLLGIVGGIVAVIYLLLGYQEGGSPLWTLLGVLALALIARELPAGKLAVAALWSRRIVLALLIVIALPFALGQVRMALYPQLEGERSFAFANGVQQRYLGKENGAATDELKSMASGGMQTAPMAVAPPAPPIEEPAPVTEVDSPQGSASDSGQWRHRKSQQDDNLERIVVTGSNIRRVDTIDHYDKSTAVQTGGGEPDWHFGSRYQLSWSGPVLATQSVRMIIAPPWLVRSLRVVLVVLLAWLMWRIAGTTETLRIRSLPITRTAAALLAASALGLTMLAHPSIATAQAFPSDELLQQFQQRLTEAPRCAPACVTLAQAQVSAHGNDIVVALEIHAGERMAVPLPGDEKTLSLRSASIDGSAQAGFVGRDGKTWIAVARGVHRIELVFSASADKSALAFPLTPQRVLFNGDGWQASGISDEVLLTNTLNLARTAADGGTAAAKAQGAQQFPPYVRVVRTLNLGLNWSVVTNVIRLAPREGGFTSTLPILAGEHVSTPGLKVKDGQITVAIGDDAAGASWQGTLDKSDSLTLTAPTLTDHAERWRILVSPTWHLDYTGLPESGSPNANDPNDFHEFQFDPLPGETLTLKVVRPTPVEGATRAIDSVSLVSDLGQRASTTTLALNVRASQGGEQLISIPADAEVLSLKRDGEALNLRPRDGKLSLPIAPGSQAFELAFRAVRDIAIHERTSAIALGLPAANIDLRMNLPDDRWLLAAFGPGVGPAVLFWGELLVMIALAFMLSRWCKQPLRFHQWLLLGLGFSTFSWLALLIVILWLCALDWRARESMTARDSMFNPVQIGLAVLTVVALFYLFAGIRNGLLGAPDMVVTGNGSYAHALHWFTDRSTDELPVAHVITLPLWCYRVAMLAWSLWLAWSLVGWLRRGFAAWMAGGYWAMRTPKVQVDLPPPPPPVVVQ